MPDGENLANAHSDDNAAPFKDHPQVLKASSNILSLIEQVNGETNINVAQILTAILDEEAEVHPPLGIILDAVIVRHS